MARELKFRVWDERYERYVSHVDLTLIGQRDYITEQWTGLTDHTSRGVFEGDILALHPNRRQGTLIGYADDDDSAGEGWKGNAGRTPIYEMSSEPPTGPVVDVLIYPVGVVEWQNDMARFHLRLARPNERGVSGVDLDDYGYTLEMVGNIHENSELLEGGGIGKAA